MPFLPLDESLAVAAPATTLGAPLTSTGETLASLRAELQLQVIRSDVLPARYNLWINKAYRHLASIITLNEVMGSIALPTQATKYLYKIPDAVAWIKDVALNDPTLYNTSGGQYLLQTDIDTFRTLPDALTYTPTYGPYKWFRYRRMIVLWPIPASVQSLTVDFKIRPTDLTLDTHSPILPLEWHDAILLRARYVAFRSLQLFDKAAIAQNDFVTEIRELENTDAEEESSKVASVQPISQKLSSKISGFSGRVRNYDL